MSKFSRSQLAELLLKGELPEAHVNTKVEVDQQSLIRVGLVVILSAAAIIILVKLFK